MSRYANKTEVSVEKSQAELKKILIRYGATAFMLGESGDRAMIQFSISGRIVKFTLEMPDRSSDDFLLTSSRGLERSEAAAYKAWEQACRQKWRALCLFVHATLEAVEEGVVDFDEAMMPVTLIDGRHTFHEKYGGDVKEWIKGGHAPAHLALPGVEESGT